MITKTRKYRTLEVLLLLIILFSCDFRKNNNTNQPEFNDCEDIEILIDTNYYLPVTYNDIELLINKTIELYIELKREKFNKFCIDFCFGQGVLGLVNFENFSQIALKDTTLFFNKDQLKQVVNDQNYLLQKCIKNFLYEENKKFIYDGSVCDIVLSLDPPSIDRENSIVMIVFLPFLKFAEMATDPKYYPVTPYHLFLYKKETNGEWNLLDKKNIIFTSNEENIKKTQIEITDFKSVFDY